MKTAVGVFSNLERAEQAIRALRKNNVPPERITFLTRSELEAASIGKHLEGQGVLQLHTGTPAPSSVLSVSGIGPVLVQGPDVSDIFERPPANQASGPPASNEPWRQTSASPGSEEDAAFFRRMLMEGCCVIVVRSDSHQVAMAACEVLDELSLGIRKHAPGKSGVSIRQLPHAVVATFTGKLALDDGCGLLRETVRALLDGGQRRILLNLEQVNYLDSTGLGELVRTHVAAHGRGGHLTLVHPSPNVRHLLHLTKVDEVFDIAPDELSAIERSR
jgi:anti-sigma B factor antagonist